MKSRRIQFLVCMIVIASLAASLFAVMIFVMNPLPLRAKLLHREIESLQEKLISAQITSRNLNEVQKLIDRNLAFSSQDTMAQGSSLSFLQDLTQVLDILKISLVSLEPQSVVEKGRFIETPYRLEILCDYGQFCQLANKMEKSPRLISIREFEMQNTLEDYFSDKKRSLEQCRIQMTITTLTLVRKQS